MMNNTDLYSKYTVFILTIVFFFCLCQIVGGFGIPIRARTDSWTWRNHVVSGLHGFIAGIWVCVCLKRFPELLLDPEKVDHLMIYNMVVFCSGYFVYDFLDHLINGKSRQQWEVTLHHVACIATFWYNWHTNTFVGYSFIALSVEGNSFVLHSRKLLRVCGFGLDSNIYLACVVMNFITFIIFRVISIILVFRGTYIEYFRYPDIKIVFLAFICTVIVAVVNVVLLWRLIKTDIIRPLTHRHNSTKIHAKDTGCTKKE